MADKDDDLHSEGLELYKLALERDQHNREAYEEDIKFGLLADQGYQWPDAIRKQREKDGRPCLTLNRMTSFIRQVTNDARQNKPSIKFHPVGDGSDQWTAKVLDGVARNIEVSSNADVAYDTANENAVAGNVGYFRIITDYAADDAFDQDIKIERIANSLSVVPDPYDLGADSAGWNDAWVTETYSLKAFKKKWPDADTSSFEAGGSGVEAEWLDGDDILVAEWWTRREVDATLLLLSNGEVMFEDEYLKAVDVLDAQGVTIVKERPTRTMKVTQHLMNGCEILETNEWAGKYIPIIPVYGSEVIIDGKRYLKSLIRDAKDAQRMFNYWRTTSTELVALAPKAPWVGAVGQFSTDPNWASANTDNHQFLEYDTVDVNGQPAPPPQRQPFAGPPAGALQEALNASDDMKSIIGIYDASLGAKSNETSGRAILARQREGDVSTFNFADNTSRAIRHAGRILADLIPKVYTTARILRIIGEDGTPQNVPVNQPTQPLPDHAKQMGEQAEGIAHVYDLTTGKYDVTCESGPSYTTKREEAAAQMTEFMRAVPGAGQVMGDLLAKNLDWPGADEIAERLKLLLPPALQGQNPQLQQAQQHMEQMAQAIQHLQQALAQAQEQLKAKDTDKQLDVGKLMIEAHRADTDRIKAVGAGMSPEQVQALIMQTLQQVFTEPPLPGAGPAAPMPPMPAPQPMEPPAPGAAQQPIQ
jgi:hypothetical protein